MLDTVGFYQMLWLVMLESTKDRILGVDTPGQHVSPRVQYGMSCLLIRDVVGSVPCSDEWEVAWSFSQPTWCKRGHGTATTLGNLIIATVPRLP
jgi:hypothetical protein